MNSKKQRGGQEEEAIEITTGSEIRTFLGIIILLLSIPIIIFPFFYEGTTYQIGMFVIAFAIFCFQFSSFFL
jgi:hypothetical protein